VQAAPRLPASARLLGQLPGSAGVSGSVAVKPRDPAGLAAAAAASASPRSPAYHHYLARAGFSRRYGPSPATVSAVESTLRADHLTVTSVRDGGLLVGFRGTAAAASAAFHTGFTRYRLAGGRTGEQPTGALSLPAAIAGSVTAVIGLGTVGGEVAQPVVGKHPAVVKARMHPFTHAPGSPSPCAAATSAATVEGGLTDDQIGHAYGVDGLYDSGDLGAGQTVAIYEEEPFSAADVRTFDNCYFGPAKAAEMAKRLHVVDVGGGPGTGPGDGEAILDVEDVSALAPDATIEVYEAAGSETSLLNTVDAFDQIVTADTAQVVSISYGLCEADVLLLNPGLADVENELFQQAAVQGQTVFAAAGDAGSDSCSYQSGAPAAPDLSTMDPASQPFVTAVGGTTITDATNAPAEHVWNDGASGQATGGGVSAIWGAPSWQEPAFSGADRSAVTGAYADGAQRCAAATGEPAGDCRQLPDVSAQADELTGAVTVYSRDLGGWGTVGGTSSAAPLWAAMVADVDATARCRASGGVGFASPALYAVAGNPTQRARSFTDITAGTNDVFDLHGGRTYAALPGYDAATGLGSPRLSGPRGQAGLAAYLCTGPSAAGRPTITGVDPGSEPLHPSGSLTLHGSHFTGAAAVSIGSYDVPSSNWNVVDDTELQITQVPAASLQTGGLGPQDGAGRVVVSVTGAHGVSSVPGVTGTLLYVDQDTGSGAVPSVSGVTRTGGPQAGGTTVTVLGSGFTGTTSVTVGGVTATGLKVRSDSRLTVTMPPYAPTATACAPGDDPARDICQAQLVVHGPGGASGTARILPAYNGEPYYGAVQGLSAGSEPACVKAASCELVPATSEYDYLPAPSVTSVTPGYLSEEGDTVAVIRGTGFDALGLQWTDIGSPGKAAHRDQQVLFQSPTEIDVSVVPRTISLEPVEVPVAVQTLGGRSPARNAHYAGVPELTRTSPKAGPATGGTRLHLTGRGFTGSTPADGGSLLYEGVEVSEQLSGYVVHSDSSITGRTPQSAPGDGTVSVCTVTDCSQPYDESSYRASEFTFFAPGEPRVTSVSPRRGPAHGGTDVTLHGHNLSQVVAVRFGTRVAHLATTAHAAETDTAYQVTVVAPPGKAAATRPVTVETVESRYAGKPSRRTHAARFTWTPSTPAPPRGVRASVHDTTVTERWRPPAVDGGAPILGYRVVARAVPNPTSGGLGDGGGPVVRLETGSRLRPPRSRSSLPPSVVVTTGPAGRRATLRHLKGGFAYVFEVEAVNRHGRGQAARADAPRLVHQKP
jgi:hypothetical protein